MKAKNTIFIDDPKAERLGITPQGFRDFFAWDCRPHYIGITRLKPYSQEDLHKFFQTAQTIYSTVVICAPQEDVIEASKQYGYELKKDPAGLPYLTNEKTKQPVLAHTTGQGARKR